MITIPLLIWRGLVFVALTVLLFFGEEKYPAGGGYAVRAAGGGVDDAGAGGFVVPLFAGEPDIRQPVRFV